MALQSAWTNAAFTITTKVTTDEAHHTVNIPPVRRRGQRESIKENVEAAEIGTLVALVETTLNSLVSTINTYQAALPGYISNIDDHMEAAKSKTESR